MKRYRIDNWSEYNQSLIKRGSITFWVEESALKGWLSNRKSKKRGRPQKYSNESILMLLLLREVYHLPLRALQGFASSIFLLMGLSLSVPCYTQICRRAQKLQKVLKRLPKGGVIDVVFDSTGLKVYGEGEWKVRTHGAGKRRTWKKLHICINPSTQEILMSSLTECKGGDAATATKMIRQLEGDIGKVLGDGAYDDQLLRKEVHGRGGKILVPPPRNATYKGAKDGWERKRDETLAEIEGLGGDGMARAIWKKLNGYHRRSLVETCMYRIKQITGAKLKSRCKANQGIESECKCLVMNRMSTLGLPKGHWEIAT